MSFGQHSCIVRRRVEYPERRQPALTRLSFLADTATMKITANTSSTPATVEERITDAR
jgi:hypothetical protein